MTLAGPSGTLGVHIRPRMGTLLALTLIGPRAACQLAAQRAFDVAAALDHVMTRFDASSDLNRVGAGAGRFVPVPAELARALRLARHLARTTDGAFDPTVGPLVEVWRRAADAGTTPSRAKLIEACRAVDWRRLEVRAREVRLADRSMALDLDGFGKGWAADRLARTLRRVRGLSALVNFGESSIASVGKPPRRGGWPILVRDPAGGYAGWFALGRGACSTSATRRRDPGSAVRITRSVVDPRTGDPVRHRAQVTVVAATAAVAEAASTAFLVVGRSAMQALAARLRAEACWIDDDGVATTPGFRLQTLGARSVV